MIVLDASVLIAYMDPADVHHEDAKALFLTCAEESARLVVGPVTLAESLVVPARANRLLEWQSTLRALAVSEIPFGPDAPTRLAILRAGTGLKMPDCCVLLAADDANAEAIITFDDRLANVATERGLTVRSV